MLLSLHRDADTLETLAHRLGFGTVRGSSSRGGATAIHEMIKRARNWQLTMTPDGPRGPRRKMAPGAIFLASHLGIPIIPLGVGYDRPWRLPTWDRFAIPRPWSRARLIAGPPIFIPSNLTHLQREHFTHTVERLVNQLTTMAEDWAREGYRIKNASDMFPGPRRSLLYFALPRKAEIAETSHS